MPSYGFSLSSSFEVLPMKRLFAKDAAPYAAVECVLSCCSRRHDLGHSVQR